MAESIEFAFHVKGFFTCTGEHYSPYHLLKLPQFPFVRVCFQGWTGWIFKLLLFAQIQSNCLTPKWLLESVQNCFCHTTLTEINAGFKLFSSMTIELWNLVPSLESRIMPAKRWCKNCIWWYRQLQKRGGGGRDDFKTIFLQPKIFRRKIKIVI